MYADDTVIYAHDNNISQVAENLTKMMEHVAEWLRQTSLSLKVNITVAIYLSFISDDVMAVKKEKKIEVESFEHFDILIDKTLMFKSQIQKVYICVKFNIHSFCEFVSVIMFMHSISYCYINLRLQIMRITHDLQVLIDLVMQASC